MSYPIPENVSEIRAKAFGAFRVAAILLFVSVAINYIDRGDLSIAAPLIKTEFHLSNSQLGFLLSAFFWTYAPFQLVAGWLVERFEANWVLLIGFAVWSAGTAGVGFVGGVGSLLALRYVTGIGESVAYPCYSKILAVHCEENQRGAINALIDIGAKCGPIVGTFLGGLLVAWAGWRPLFLILGFGAVLWIPFWIKGMPRRRERVEAVVQPGILEILSRRSAWATFAGLFCSNYYWYFFLTWLPSYFIQARHYSMHRMAIVATLPYCFIATGTFTAARLSFKAIARGATPTRVRKTCTALGLGLGSTIAVVPLIANDTASLIVLLFASFSYGMYTSSHWSITQTIAGPDAAGRWSGFQNCIGNLAGVVGPWMTGFLVQRTGNFAAACAAVGAVALAGSMIYLFALGPVEPAVWRGKAAAA